jgi:hypothetical protein
MKGGEWIWILVIAFGLIRLLMRAKKKKAEEGQVPPIPQPGSHPGRSAAPARRRSDPLKSFIDSLTDRYDQNARPDRSIPIPIEPEELCPPPPRRRPPATEKPQPVRKAPPAITQTPVRRESIPVEQEIGGHFNFSRNPIIQGIIFSEIIGPPRGMGEGRRLPSDL